MNAECGEMEREASARKRVYNEQKVNGRVFPRFYQISQVIRYISSINIAYRVSILRENHFCHHHSNYNLQVGSVILDPSTMRYESLLFLSLLSLTSALPGSSRWGPSSAQTPCHSTQISAEWRETVVKNWLAIWNEMDFTLLDATVSPNITINQDRFATGGGGSVEFVINNATAFQGFVEASRQGFSKYIFEGTRYFGEDDLVALEWTLDAVVETSTGLVYFISIGVPGEGIFFFPGTLLML